MTVKHVNTILWVFVLNEWLQIEDNDHAKNHANKLVHLNHVEFGVEKM